VRVLARRGMVASPHYLASQAGLRILRQGGNAVDAAIAINSVLAVVTPYLCGIGGDLFAQIYLAGERKLLGLNGSGRAPQAATPERVRALAGGTRVPARGPLAVTVPGCVEAWEQLSRRFGRLPLPEILDDAVHYAEHGILVTRQFAGAIAASAGFFHPSTPARETFLPGGALPHEGDILVQPRLAETLRAIAREGAGIFYRGPLAQEIARSVQAAGGLLSADDLARHSSDWVEPLSIPYRGVTVHELPPNSQGIIALLMLQILNQLPAAPIQEGGAEYIHTLAEVARLAYADREAYITDPGHMTAAIETLISAGHAGTQAGRIGPNVSSLRPAASPGDTIYCCAADQDGNLVSLIESNFMGFGSGVMAGETGIMLQNRGHWFSLEPAHINVIAPGKRTMHTLMPGMAFRDDRPWLVFGSMGGSTQAQIHVELLTRLIDQGLAVDEAIDAPRFDAVAGSSAGGSPLIQLEDRFPPAVIAELERRGHAVELLPPLTGAMGHAHAIQILPNGGYVGAADPRSDSAALGY